MSEYFTGGAILFYLLVGLVIASIIVLLRALGAGNRQASSRTITPDAASFRIAQPPDAPDILIRFLVDPKQGEMLEFINESAAAIIGLSIGPLVWEERRPVRLCDEIGTLFPSHPQKRRVSLEKSPHSFGSLCQFIRTNTPSDADTSVTVTYQDSKGRNFSRAFTLTTKINGGMFFTPRPARFLG